MTARSLMFQGTGSDVGKSVIVAGLCRLALNRGIKVAPFKPQNMSNNAAVCDDGGEIGRAQALQAVACGLPPSIHFNPVLLKPQSDKSAQVIVQGQSIEAQSAEHYMNEGRPSLLPAVLESYQLLKDTYDLVLAEGAGSPTEVNLRKGDIANMGFASAANVPVCLIADIDRGGVIASLVGSQQVLDDTDRELIKGFIINKFRGDPRLFDDGLKYICDTTQWPAFGVVPWLYSVAQLPAEDAVPLQNQFRPESEEPRVRIAAPMLSRIANFDDLDPLRFHPSVEVVFVPPGQPIPLNVDAVILLGTKSAIADLRFLRNQGWHHDIQALARAGKHILGVCGGYQMLGTKIDDPNGYDDAAGTEVGLGLLDVQTTMQASKKLVNTEGKDQHGNFVKGYEIHTGTTTGPDANRPYLTLTSGPDGAQDMTGRVCGTYLHGLFNNDSFRTNWLAQLKTDRIVEDVIYQKIVEQSLDQLAHDLESNLDVDALFAAAC